MLNRRTIVHLCALSVASPCRLYFPAICMEWRSIKGQLPCHDAKIINLLIQIWPSSLAWVFKYEKRWSAVLVTATPPHDRPFSAFVRASIYGVWWVIMSELFGINCVENWQFLYKFRLFQCASLSADDLLLMMIKCDQYCFQPQSTEKEPFSQHTLNSIGMGLGRVKNTQIPIKILIEIESLLNNTPLVPIIRSWELK